jgi:hypothetical protein
VELGTSCIMDGLLPIKSSLLYIQFSGRLPSSRSGCTNMEPCEEVPDGTEEDLGGVEIVEPAG